jgi:hypothetical protein
LSSRDFILAVQISEEERFGKWFSSIEKARDGIYVINIDEICAQEALQFTCRPPESEIHPKER